MSIYSKAMDIINSSKAMIRNIDYEDVHTRHCCKIHGCMYGNAYCTVMTTELKGMTGDCQTCYDRTRFDDIEYCDDPNDGAPW